MKNRTLMTVILTGLISTSVFAATQAATGTAVDTPAAKASKSLVEAKAGMQGMGGMEAKKSDKPSGKSGKTLAKTKTELQGMGGMEARKSDKPSGKSGKTLAKTKTDLQGMGGMEANK